MPIREDAVAMQVGFILAFGGVDEVDHTLPFLQGFRCNKRRTGHGGGCAFLVPEGDRTVFIIAHFFLLFHHFFQEIRENTKKGQPRLKAAAALFKLVLFIAFSDTI